MSKEVLEVNLKCVGRNCPIKGDCLRYKAYQSDNEEYKFVLTTVHACTDKTTDMFLKE